MWEGRPQRLQSIGKIDWRCWRQRPAAGLNASSRSFRLTEGVGNRGLPICGKAGLNPSSRSFRSTGGVGNRGLPICGKAGFDAPSRFSDRLEVSATVGDRGLPACGKAQASTPPVDPDQLGGWSLHNNLCGVKKLWSGGAAAGECLGCLEAQLVGGGSIPEAGIFIRGGLAIGAHPAPHTAPPGGCAAGMRGTGPRVLGTPQQVPDGHP
ncbi:hypothetical protein PSTG_15806 [Puccinia striiformis f. sp. tritici PST-78]|uniref:Uncharacterized protein n=1 Tax=Puccinia striiformis f. sp. tritici PST-78 TaxID=1165861 RepID=A0A0L0UUN3_9BASI|nr:hypothetical protein PSTG_15806 [Puccinia striiformis f. sp. tritici PST-78]